MILNDYIEAVFAHQKAIRSALLIFKKAEIMLCLDFDWEFQYPFHTSVKKKNIFADAKISQCTKKNSYKTYHIWIHLQKM